MVRTLEAAAAWVDEVGLALLFPKADVVLPSLWEQVNGSRPRTGRSASRTARSCAGPTRWRSSGARRTSCRRRGSSASASTSRGSRPASRPGCCRLLVAAAEPAELDDGRAGRRRRDHRRRPADRAAAPRASPGLPKKASTGSSPRCTGGSCSRTAQLVEQDGPWGAIAHDLLARKWRLPKRLPPRDEARRELARARARAGGRADGGRPGRPVRLAAERSGRRARDGRRAAATRTASGSGRRI